MVAYTDPTGRPWSVKKSCKSGLTAFYLGRTGPSGFGSSTPAHRVAATYDGNGKVVIITGASSGLGYESTKVLAKRGADVIMAVRDMSKGQACVDKIREHQPDAKLTLLLLDLTKLQSVREFVARFKELQKPLHTLLLNAGIMAPPQRMTSDGYESQFQVNYLSHFLLAELLTPELAKTASSRHGCPNGRIVILSSATHFRARPPSAVGLPFHTFDSQKDYSPMAAYGRSKLCNVLMAREYNVRHANQHVEAVSCHPGIIATGIRRELPLWRKQLIALATPLLKSRSQGAATQIYCATTHVIKAGAFYADCNEQPASALAYDGVLGAALWEWSTKHVGL